ncbi:Hypothetical protein R9X50_00379100 [Acrodontium crateriforme]|uniref:G-protein coupled receptors family 1 profile domain-containing protein n=1 Tax=Acrodontium crateriforme TaxID=150365 RepID=A0AAQ3M362_9PEZI|nr:Hypothetical protein R9X50_00379100 [Acrodontium crateriforme]
MTISIISSPLTLSPLPSILHRGLISVSILGLVSFISTIILLLQLTYRLTLRRNKSENFRTNQFIILLFNLLLADVQQSTAFLLNLAWLRSNSISSGTATCFVQGWFVSIGDLASGVFTLAIATHAFADIVFEYRLSRKQLVLAIAGLWIFVYSCTIVGIAMHPTDYYTRAGAWCWVNNAYSSERLWLHYFWILVAEFGTVLIYASLGIILHRRIRTAFYTTETQVRAQSAAKLIVAYPIVYVVCTLPLVTARLRSMAGSHHVTFAELCVAGAMITSNGWLDVLLYSVTRRAALFGPDLTNEGLNVLATFQVRPDQAFGTTTTIEATTLRDVARKRSLAFSLRQRRDSQEALFDAEALKGVKTETVVQITMEEIEMETRSHLSSEAAISKETLSLNHKGDS